MLYLEVCCRVVVGLVFLLAVAGKLRGRAELTAFTESLGSFGLRPARLRSALATTVIAVEAVAVVLLAVAPRLGLGFAALVLVAFSGAVLAAKATGREVRCRCFGADGGLMGRKHLIRNGVLVAVALTGLVPATSAATPHLGLLAATTSAAVLAAVALAHWDDLRFVLRAGPAARPAHDHHH
ncbi:MauE/DoxX family redox-associated membrane protein [Nocardia sp. NRRL S-836]|uniref:MauE/DoxX family redox-associated membrane protein n=1 Tax=Nocardia sp. NRRL S-836 TaxID=1519492 RepID=UPI0006AE3399|nr:MauE/DoxX family redox-associated membrane protein [Nocardia sp. NRRL S-836]